MKKIGLILIFFTTNALGLVIGSDSIVSYYNALQTFPTGQFNEINIFAYDEGGFILADQDTALIFNSVFPVANQILLNSGQLILEQNLILKQPISQATLLGAKIAGNGHVLDLGSAVSFLEPASTPTYKQLFFITNSKSDQAVQSVDWSFDGNYLASARLNALGTKEVVVFSFVNQILTEVASFQTDADIYSVRWNPADYYLAVIAAKNAATPIAGSEVFTLSFTTSENLYYIDGINTNVNTYAGEWSPDGAYLAITKAEALKKLTVYPITDGAFGAAIDDGVLGGGDLPYFRALSWDSTGVYIAMPTASDLHLFSFNGAALTLEDSLTMADTIYAIDYSPLGTFIAVGIRNQTNRLRLVSFDGATLTEELSKNIGAANPFAVSWCYSGLHLVTGQDSVIGVPELKGFEFSPTATTINFTSGATFGSDVMDIRWHPGDCAFGFGTIVGSVLPSMEWVYSFTQGSFWDNVTVVLTRDLQVSGNLKFSGNSAILGNGCSVELIGSGSLSVGINSSLLLENVTIKNVSGRDFSCEDSTSTVSLRNVDLIQVGDVIFDQGHFDVLGEFKISGGYVFAYQTDQISTITSNGEFILDYGSTFSYNPTTSNRDLLAMVDETSVLTLNGATLYSTSTGLRLINGTLNIASRSYLISEGVVDADSISLGNDIAANNLHIDPKADLKMQGCVSYHNV
ncbi:MAG: hypothetical protein UR26_C0006G0002 [candidate division TM6 bacterium GW2011_GWF2_32_72]|nr:MAG: hypothetical protein UR26_C0006G0002 [candidate division TM6 bacterium GW2011_GWF2_32_72]